MFRNKFSLLISLKVQDRPNLSHCLENWLVPCIAVKLYKNKLNIKKKNFRIRTIV